MTKVPLNVPNILTFFRFALIPPAVICVLNNAYIPAVIIFAVACLTDLLDGYIARKYNMVSEAGTLLDPLADKLMAVGMALTLYLMGIYPLFVFIIIFAKEGLMILGGIFLYKREIVAGSNIVGKIAALLFNISLGLALLNQYLKPDIYLTAMYVSLGLMIIALLQYAYLNVYRKLKARKK